MKKLYPFVLLLLLQLVLRTSSYAQCADGSAITPEIIDTTISFEPGVTSTQVKFPQFDPEHGMLRCVKLTVTIIGVIDTAAMQNLSTTTQTATLKYKRNDEMRGPGLKTALSNSYNKDYGPYSLTAFDRNYDAGTDYITIPRDTIIQKSMVRTLTDSVEISQFYGHDSLTYDYDIDVSTQASISGGSSSNMVLTSAVVNFKFEYCTCPKVTLPVGLKNFTVTKTSPKRPPFSGKAKTTAMRIRMI